MKNQELKQFMDRNGWGQKQVAQHFGKSVTTISQYLNGKYPTDTAELDAKTDELIALYKQKTSEAKYSTQFVRTLVAERGMEIMQYAHADGEINVIYGAAGLGKTQMLKQYAKENSSAVLIEVDPSCTPKVLLKKSVRRWAQIVEGLTTNCLTVLCRNYRAVAVCYWLMKRNCFQPDH